MANAVILKTNKGIKLCGSIQCSNGMVFDAQGCYNYCQSDSNRISKLQATKLMNISTSLGTECTEENWYENRNNFIDVTIPFDCTQITREELL